MLVHVATCGDSIRAMENDAETERGGLLDTNGHLYSVHALFHTARLSFLPRGGCACFILVELYARY